MCFTMAVVCGGQEERVLCKGQAPETGRSRVSRDRGAGCKTSPNRYEHRKRLGARFPSTPSEVEDSTVGAMVWMSSGATVTGRHREIPTCLDHYVARPRLLAPMHLARTPGADKIRAIYLHHHENPYRASTLA
jgi:hypothetical protein